MEHIHPNAIELRPPRSLRPSPANARSHPRKQIKQIAQSIERFGFTSPVLIDDDDHILAGHGRVEAAKLLGLKAVPTIKISHLNEAERRAYMLADNKLALNAGWDQAVLALELQGLMDFDFDVSLTGFSLAELDFALDAAREADPKRPSAGADQLPLMSTDAVSQKGDLWILGRHRLLCGDSRDTACFERLLGEDRAALIFTDPPYNIRIDRYATGKGQYRHREFAMAIGEMSPAAFTEFLTQTLANHARYARDGAIAYVAMDWRHMGELLAAGRAAFNELKNLCVWNKTNAGMGSFYRSKHEMIFVFKVGTGPHINNFGLGADGRHRANVWDYAGVSGGGAARDEALAMHPTVKPVALVADAIRDCSRRGDIILDGFGGSGATLIAAELCGRTARLIEIDPLYVDTIVRRFEQFTGTPATLAKTGETFEAVGDDRQWDDIA
jgi:DNA modification methylase